MAATAIPATHSRGEAFGQPRGLWVLAGTELWERISFHGMQALLTLYMIDQLLLPGHVEHVVGFAGYRAAVESVTGPLSVTALAAQTFGFYIGLIYFTPVLGGMVGDWIRSRRAAVILGGLLMTAGHFSLAFDRSFLIALLLLILGAGLLRGNLPAQLKSVYADGDRREADAFQFYYVAINIGAFVAPLVTGALASWWSWHLAFGFAGFGMLTGLLLYLAGGRYLPKSERRLAERSEKIPLTREERKSVLLLLALCPLVTCFWVAQSQVWNVYNLWAREHLDLTIGTFAMPVFWLQSLDGVSPILVMPFFLALWRRQARMGREPGHLAKMGIGCLIFGAATSWLAAASLVGGADGRAPLLWAVAFHLSSNIGWLYMTPIAMAFFAARAPVRLRGTMLGINYLNAFFGSVISGRLGGLYEQLSAAQFWLLHAAIVAGGGLCLLVLARPLERALAPDAR